MFFTTKKIFFCSIGLYLKGKKTFVQLYAVVPEKKIIKNILFFGHSH